MGNGSAHQQENAGPVGTEYTLQGALELPTLTHATWLTLHPGVMRFLQLEWHNHERARNAWDIERAEMKAKIAKQEGEVRSAKRLNEQLEKHVKMLENALRNERQKSKEKPADQDKQDSKGKERASPDLKRKRTWINPSPVQVLADAPLQPRPSTTTPSSMSSLKPKSCPSRNGTPSVTSQGSSSPNASRKSRTCCSRRRTLHPRTLNYTLWRTRPAF